MIEPDKLTYEAKPHEILAEYLYKIGWRPDCDAQWTELRDNMETVHRLSAPPSAAEKVVATMIEQLSCMDRDDAMDELLYAGRQALRRSK